MNSFELLPHEINLKIYSYLSPEDFLNLCLLDKYLYNLLNNNESWMKYVKTRYDPKYYFKSFHSCELKARQWEGIFNYSGININNKYSWRILSVWLENAKPVLLSYVNSGYIEYVNKVSISSVDPINDYFTKKFNGKVSMYGLDIIVSKQDNNDFNIFDMCNQPFKNIFPIILDTTLIRDINMNGFNILHYIENILVYK